MYILKQKNTIILSVIFILIASFACNKTNKIVIESKFPGGNIIIDSIRQDTIWLKPDQRDTKQEKWFYWSFKVSNAQNKTLTFIFNHPYPLTRFGPSYSKNNGESWLWLSDTLVDSKQFQFSFDNADKEVLFCLSLPYVEKNLNSFLAQFEDNLYLESGSLCLSKQGRNVEYLSVKKKGITAKYAIITTARHHACETTGSFVLEGMLSQLLAKSNVSEKLLDSCDFYFIPFVDKDGVENGDQGKLRDPHDHNADYALEMYNEIKSLKDSILKWSENKLIIAFDLHCPWIKYGWDEKIFIVGSSSKKMSDNEKEFASILHEKQTGTLFFDSLNIFPFGIEWNKTSIDDSINNKLYFGEWMTLQPNTLFVSTLEIPYAVNNAQKITASGCREFGADLMISLHDFIKHHDTATVDVIIE